MTSYPETLRVKKLMKMESFMIKIYYISSSNDSYITHTQGWIYWGAAGGGGCTPPAPARGVLFFMIKQKIIRDKMRFSNLSNNMMISEL
jgi:hypothetical protein